MKDMVLKRGGVNELRILTEIVLACRGHADG